ncbi:fibrinogen c domain-containing protein 1-like [Plakobranchus ocellatus]|uniref:Fibrinogen c domain-containing protein 1-like n=1 Tax=Plakobranchus ocellatus TaxID=259542 RepID=A0AAV4BYC5_9GAST|nr:fibrinogen c domain-containing protein 1-like [Plakobranchus ocellatus]
MSRSGPILGAGAGLLSPQKSAVVRATRGSVLADQEIGCELLSYITRYKFRGHFDFTLEQRKSEQAEGTFTAKDDFRTIARMESHRRKSVTGCSPLFGTGMRRFLARHLYKRHKSSLRLLIVLETVNGISTYSITSHLYVIVTGKCLSQDPSVRLLLLLSPDCASVYSAGHHRSGVFYIKPLYAACPIPVWCDMDSPGGGWLLLQRRRNGRQSFNRNWAAYRAGFGDVAGEHWLGNDNIFLLTNQGRYQLRVDLWDFSGNRVHALYTNFKVDGERDQYRLHVSGYSGSAQDSLHRHNQKKFSTPDRDNDSRSEASCAQEWEAGWWFDNCWFALLNGPYHNKSDVSWRGLAWNHWKREQLRASEMKIRPVTRRGRS